MIENIGRTETTNYVRGALKKAFPGIKFSVRGKDTGISVQWVDGPITADVDAVVNPYRGATFDPMDDLKSPRYAWMYEDGRVVVSTDDLSPGAKRVRFAFDWINVSRDFSYEFLQRASAYIANDRGLPPPELTKDEIWVAGKPSGIMGGHYVYDREQMFGIDSISQFFTREVWKLSEEMLFAQDELAPLPIEEAPPTPIIEEAPPVEIAPPIPGMSVRHDRGWTWVEYQGKDTKIIRGLVGLGFEYAVKRKIWCAYDIVSEQAIYAVALPTGNIAPVAPPMTPPVASVPKLVKEITVVDEPVVTVVWGDRHPPDPKRAEKLRSLADGWDGEIARKRATHAHANPTHKRQREMEHAHYEADAMQAGQRILREMADLWESGDVPIFLRGVTSKKEALRLGMAYKRWDKYRNDRHYAIKLETLDEVEQWAINFIEGAKDPHAEKLRKLEYLKRKCLLDNVGFDYFPTPYAVAHETVGSVRTPRDKGLILEPSAGTGGLACVAREMYPHNPVHCVEASYPMREILELQDFPVVEHDIFNYVPGPIYALAVMNPPFSGDIYIRHVRHVWEMIEPGGQLMAIVPGGIKFRNGKVGEFRDWVQEFGYIEDLPSGAFKESGTGVATCYLVMDKP